MQKLPLKSAFIKESKDWNNLFCLKTISSYKMWYIYSGRMMLLAEFNDTSNILRSIDKTTRQQGNFIQEKKKEIN